VTPRRRPDDSPFVGAIEPITESDDDPGDPVRGEIPLLPALAYATGDISLLREHPEQPPGRRTAQGAGRFGGDGIDVLHAMQGLAPPSAQGLCVPLQCSTAH
jgi:hypothetical protein